MRQLSASMLARSASREDKIRTRKYVIISVDKPIRLVVVPRGTTTESTTHKRIANKTYNGFTSCLSPSLFELVGIMLILNSVRLFGSVKTLKEFHRLLVLTTAGSEYITF